MRVLVGFVVFVLVCALVWLACQGVEPTSPVNPIPNRLAKIDDGQKRLLDAYQKEWEVTINTQMHLNTLALTFRSAALTAFLTFLGAAATLGQSAGLDQRKRTLVLLLPLVF